MDIGQCLLELQLKRYQSFIVSIKQKKVSGAGCILSSVKYPTYCDQSQYYVISLRVMKSRCYKY